MLGDTDGSDTEGFYMPTHIHKSKTTGPSKKKKKKKPKVQKI